MSRTKTYFTSDVHLGLDAFDPAERERRFVAFLERINSPETDALYLLGDIWDFWYEWKEVVPKGSVRVFAALTALVDSGVKVYFCAGNHDIWAYRYFEELGMIKISQPAFVSIGDKQLCVGHGDGLGGGDRGYRILNAIFKCRFLQILFSSLVHPTLAIRLGKAWSKGNRLARGEKYVWKGDDEPLVKWCRKVAAERPVDLFIFGHYHVRVSQKLTDRSSLEVLDSWIEQEQILCISQEAQS